MLDPPFRRTSPDRARVGEEEYRTEVPVLVNIGDEFQIMGPPPLETPGDLISKG